MLGWDSCSQPLLTATSQGRMSISKNAAPRLTAARRRALNQLLNQYLVLDAADEKESFVGRVREKYPRLAHWFETLARESRTTTSLFSHSPAPVAEELLDSANRLPTPDLEPGTRLGPWRIHSYVGAGGMGKVYRGERADGAFEMDVAIKLIGSRRPALADHLRHECQLLAKLDHPGITRLIDAGVTDDDEPFLVMEWVEGESLEQWFDREDVNLEARLRLFCEVAEAVTHAHQRLIVHGDIKPANIHITPDGRVKLMDFGVARLLEAGPDESGGIAALTPAFASPEQREGRLITTHSDVWALGALMAWLLGGHSPHDADKLERLIQDLTSRYARGRELAAIIGKACAPEPGERYTSVSDLQAEIDRFLDHQPLRVLPGTPANRLGKAMRRNRSLTASLAVIMIMLGGGLTATSILYVQAENERERAERQAQELEQVVSFQTRQLDEVDVIAMAGDLRQRLGTGEGSVSETDFHEIDFTSVMRDLLDLHLFEPTELAIDQTFVGQPLVQARLLQSLATSRRALGLLKEAEPTQDTVLELVDAHADENDPVRLSAFHHFGLLLTSLGDPESAELKLSKALEGRKRVLGAEHPDTLNSKRNMALAQQSRGDFERAEENFRTVLEARRQVLGEDHPQTLDSILDIGVVKLRQAEYEQAELYFRQAVQGRRELLGDDHPSTLLAINNLGVLMRRMGRMEEARGYYTEALEGRRQVLGNDHPDTLMSINNQAVLHHILGELTIAEQYYREALESYRRVSGESHPDTLSTLHNIGVLKRLQGNLEAAESCIGKVLEERLQSLGEAHPLTLVSMSSLSQVLRHDDRPEEALELTTQVLKSRREQLGEQHPQTILSMSEHAANLRDSGEIVKAEELGSRSVDLARKALPPDHWRLASHMSEYARTLAVIADFEAGEELLLEAYEIMRSALGEDHVRTRSTAQALAEFYKSWDTRTTQQAVTRKKLHWQEIVEADSGEPY